MRANNNIVKLIKYAFTKQKLYAVALFLFSIQNFAILGYVTFVQYKAVDMIETQRASEIYKIALMVFGIYGVTIALLCSGMLLMDYVRFGIDNDLKYKIFSKTLGKKGGVDNVTEIESRMINDTSQASVFVTYELGMLLMPFFSLIGILIVLFVIDVKMGLISMATMIIPIVYNLIVLPSVKRIAEKLVLLRSDYLKRVGRFLNAYSTIKLNNLYHKQISYTDEVRTKVLMKQYLENTIFSVRTMLTSLTNTAAAFFILLMSIGMYRSGSLSLSVLVILPQLILGLVEGVEGVCSFTLKIQQPKVAAKRVFEIIEEPEPKYNMEQDEAPGTVADEHIISVNGLTFSYDGEKNIINNLDFAVKKGEILCIDGSIGTGKSTLIKLMLGFLKPKEGTIKVLDQQLDKNCETWMNNFALVEQQTSLFNETVVQNIKLSSLEDDDDEKLLEILNKLGLNETVLDLPEGLDTVINAGGDNLSGGQKQLISIARALYSNAKVIILDEFSSALDEKTEKRVLDTITSMRDEKTFVIVSHKESCKRIADTVVQVA